MRVHELHDQHAKDVAVVERGRRLDARQAAQQVRQAACLRIRRVVGREQREYAIAEARFVFEHDGVGAAFDQRLRVEQPGERHHFVAELERVRHRQRVGVARNRHDVLGDEESLLELPDRDGGDHGVPAIALPQTGGRNDARRRPRQVQVDPRIARRAAG